MLYQSLHRLRCCVCDWRPLVIACLILVQTAAAATLEITEPFVGVRRIHRQTTLPRLLDVNILEIDLTAPGVSFLVTPSNGPAPGETVAQTTRQFVAQHNLQLGVNASFFSYVSGANMNLQGLSASNGDAYSPFQADRLPALNITSDNIASIIQSTVGSGFSHSPSTTLYNAVGGNERIIANGVNVAGDTALHPRTAAGVTFDGRLLLATVDGRNAGHSLGVSTIELADVLLNFGAYNAINLDGGGSTTMVLADPIPRVVNVPVGVSNVPGSERSNGNNLGVFAQPNPRNVSRFIYADFEFGDQTNMRHRPTTSSDTSGILANSAVNAYRYEGRNLGSGQRVRIFDDPDQDGSLENFDGWFLRHLSGTGGPESAGTRTANDPRPTFGAVGFWARTAAAGVSASIALDDENDATRGRGVQRELIADGEWHRYAWNLTDVSQWEDWSGGAGMVRTPSFTIDSLQFFGPNADAVFWIDDVFHDAVSIARSDFNLDGSIDGGDLAVWKSAFNQTAAADATRDGVTDGADFLVWQRQFSGNGNAASASIAVCEPLGLCGHAVALWLCSLRWPAGSLGEGRRKLL